MHLSNQQISHTLNKFSDILLDQHIVQGESDEEALMEAMEHMAERIAAQDSQSFSRSVNSSYIDSTISRMYSHKERVQSSNDEKRKQKILEELQTLQDRPKINQNSRKYAEHMPPLYTRVNEVMRQHKDYLKALQLEQEIKRRSQEDQDCTYKPSIIAQGDRSYIQFHQSAINWQQQKERRIAKGVQEKEQMEAEAMQDKPMISDKSRVLAEKRASTPVFDRLYTKGKNQKKSQDLSFKPALNPNSMKLVNQKRAQGNSVYERLYNLRKQHLEPQPSKSAKSLNNSFNMPKAKQKNSRSPSPISKSTNTSQVISRNRTPPRKKEPIIVDSAPKGYRINLSKGPVFEKPSGVNEVKYSPGLDFLLKAINSQFN